MSVLGCRLNRSTQHPRNAYQTLAESPSRFPAASDAKAPVSRPQFCQRVLSALTDQASLQLCNRGHLCEKEFPHRPGGTLGRSQNTRSTSLATSERSRSTLRVSRSSFPKTSFAPTAFAWERAAASLGRSDFLPLSVSTYSAATVHRPPLR